MAERSVGLPNQSHSANNTNNSRPNNNISNSCGHEKPVKSLEEAARRNMFSQSRQYCMGKSAANTFRICGQGTQV